MKFLVLALCVCAASAASFGQTPFGSGGYKKYKGAPNAAAAVVAPAVAPAVVAAKTAAVVTAPVVVPIAAAAAATYNAGATAYQAAKTVVSKAYSDDSQAAIVRSDSEVNPQGYNYVYETANGISGEASGSLKQVGEASVIVSQGAYRYTAPDGTPVLITYTADENGYHPEGDVLPVGPEIPEAILRSLAYIAAQPKDAAQIKDASQKFY